MDTVACLSKAILYYMSLMEQNQNTDLSSASSNEEMLANRSDSNNNDEKTVKKIDKKEETMSDKITLTIPKKKNIALIAHDGKKAELI